MRSLKITLTLTALVAVFLLTVSGQKVNSASIADEKIEKIDKSEFKLAGPITKKGKKPPMT